MKTAIIIHGKPSKEGYYNPKGSSESNSHWLPWLQHELVLCDILAQTPEMPRPYEPVYEQWKEMFERFSPDQNTMGVGHSCGGGFLVRWLSENPQARLNKVALVAPSLGLDWDHKSFYDFEIDPNIAARTKGITLFYSDDDREAIIQAAQILSQKIQGIKVLQLHGLGHFTYEDMKGKTEFPELLQALVA
ncbi:MAG TPA: alpha/beta hydrolase [Candidatus Saccharimonadales bacterium]|nr:alpha/beta hydrolase [Candidatus Saccharimonadales bacterium]